MSLVELQSSDHFDSLLKGKKLLVLHFSTSWSEPCSDINQALGDLASELSQCVFVKIDAEHHSEISLKYEIVAVPTVLFVKDGTLIDRVDGAHIPAIVQKSRNLSKEEAVMTTPIEPTEQSQESINERLKGLINSSSCMLFMKGSPNEPRCGFSRQVVAILDQYNTDYSYFDILQNEEVRQALKKYSNWPTYPQLYVNGELIGGLDIIKELKENGELEVTLPTKII
jgi:Grx4 family monothiol glutaredoxin